MPSSAGSRKSQSPCNVALTEAEEYQDFQEENVIQSDIEESGDYGNYNGQIIDEVQAPEDYTEDVDGYEMEISFA